MKSFKRDFLHLPLKCQGEEGEKIKRVVQKYKWFHVSPDYDYVKRVKEGRGKGKEARILSSV